MADTKLTQKLKLQAAEKNLILQAPESFLMAVEGISFDTAIREKEYDYAQVFVENVDTLNSLANKVLEAIKEDAKLWFCYPKKSSGIKTDINRDRGWDVLTEAGYGGVAAVSIDDTWSALRFRHESKVDRKGAPMVKEQRANADKRLLEIPENIRVMLEAHPREKEFFDSLAYTHQKEYVQWIIDAKRADTRQRRLLQMLELLKEGKKGRYA